MASAYTSFLLSPNASHLDSNASLTYVTTTTTIHEPTAILKHLQAQQKQVVKTEEKILSTIEGQDAICLETEMTLQFRNGGCAYLPGMDENLLDERSVTFPLLHTVRLTGEGKIQQIRLYWDQGTLLKQVEAIGRTGRNWPIRDGKAQVAAVNNSLKAGLEADGTNGTTTSGSRSAQVDNVSHHKKQNSVSATRDPHASLALFAPRDPNEGAPSYDGPQHPTRASAKPAPREYSELFATEESAAQSAAGVQSPSPGKDLKSGAGKYFAKNRLFDENTPPEEQRSPESKRTYKGKYEHFALDCGDDTQQAKAPVARSSVGMRAQSHFSISDTAATPKHEGKTRPDFERHWGPTAGEDDPPSPIKRPIVHAARPDNVAHFAFTDNSPISGENAKVTRPGTNVDNSRRGEDFGAHYSLTDPLPAPTESKSGTQAKRGTARSDQETHWGFSSPAYDKKIYKTAGDGMGGRASNVVTFQHTPTRGKTMYKTVGDGMGGRGARSWGFGDESDPEVTDPAPKGRARRSQAEAGAFASA